MQKETLWALLLAPIVGPLVWFALLIPGRMFSRWLWKRLPDGRLRRVLFKGTKAVDESQVWPKLPPGP